MASIYPFRALRPAADKAAAVSSVPYDVVTTDEARDLAANDPLSFLHVTRSEIDLPSGTDPYSPEVYEKAKQNFQALRQRAPLVVDDAPALYFYRLRMGAHEQTGIAGCFSVDEYERDIIKKHERTASITRSGAPTPPSRVSWPMRSPGSRRSTSLMDTIARRAPRARAPSWPRVAMPARPIRSSRWRFLTTRCRSCRTTGPSRIWPASRRSSSSTRCAGSLR
jgi:hypothetical protein